MHRNHNVAPSASKMSGDAPRSLDNQMSLISAQYNYDGGTGPTSIREMTDSSGNVVSQYGYDPYGRQIRIGGTGPDADFGYAGYYVHERSGLNLATYRAYSPIMGRWLNRDPIQDPTFAMAARSPEQALPSAIAMVPTNDVMPRITSLLQAATAQASTDSPNSYTYVANNPIRWSDPSGLYVNQVISLPGPVIPLKGPKPPGDPPEDPEDEWNFCSKLCAKYSGKAWEECMFACLGGKKHCGTK
jgi:RHS repeat-associated protein